ncbi:unnamed protein product [Cuscuta europaea]|uniref:Uncharacterized protein n=1 Tax=Cuscuta europaea TaxID=41803 RepID=A0A9P0YT50_CUSEU|nr:unnamed protein product [Cuscuta europaea]
MMASNREARRRRIVDKGSDRIALITGQIRCLQPSCVSESELRHSHTASCPPYLSPEAHQPDLPSLGSIAEDSVSGHMLENDNEFVSEPGHKNMYEGENREGTGVSSPLGLNSKQVQVSSAAITASEGGDHRHHRKRTSNHPSIFTPQKIISAIKSCESIRIRCSLAASLLVVLCYVGCPILGTHLVKSIVLFRPLFLLLLTNTSIVVGHLLLENAGSGRVVQQESSSGVLADDNDWADRVGKALEFWLTLQKVMGALFIDASVYAISVICILSFTQQLGW